MKNKSLFFVIALPLLIGCATQQERAFKKIQCTCQNLMGCSEEEVALELGAPQNIQNIGKLKVYQYYKSYGTPLIQRRLCFHLEVWWCIWLW